MINQVDFEGYLTRSWEYHEQHYIRLANHRPGDNGKMASDYVTIRIDSSLDFDPAKVKIGRLLRVTGRIIGRDIVEPLRLVVAKSHDDIELPDELSTLIIRRPTVQILATQVRLLTETKSPKQKTKVVAKENPAENHELPVLSIQPGMDLAEMNVNTN